MIIPFLLVSFYIYIIQSQIDKSYYKGFSENYAERLKQYNLGLSKYTSTKIPWNLVYIESYDSKREALIRERKIKKYSHEQIRKLIESPGNKHKILVEEWLKSLPN